MNIRPYLSRMKSPADRRQGIWREGVLQIWVTRSCDKACVGCTQGSNLAGKPTMITVEQFRDACRSLKNYWGVVGMFGGNPTTHPDFAALCRVMQEEIPFAQRGLWSNNLRGHGAIARETFNPEVSNLNVHLDQRAYEEMLSAWPESHPKGNDSDSRHSPPYVAMQDLIPDPSERWRLIANCDVNQRWSAMIYVFRGELRGTFCELAGAQAMLHQDEPDYPDLGLPVTLDWWNQPMTAFEEQVKFHCHACGIPMRGAGDLAVNGTIEQVSVTHQNIYQLKMRSRTVQTVTMRQELGQVAVATDYIENATRRVKRPTTPVKRIDGLVTCVGKLYSDQLRKALPIWLQTLNSVTVVTTPDDRETLAMCDILANRKLNVVTTDVFYWHGARFNKGAALNIGLAAMNPLDWVLNFDADILPYPDWREQIQTLDRTMLYGADRYYDSRRIVPDWPFPCGYFHLWNVDDPRTWVRPLYDVQWGHAGNYDATFLERWPEHLRGRIQTKLIHQGEPRANWFGVGESVNPDEMKALHEIGLREVFLSGVGKIDVPEPRLKICLQQGNAGWVKEMFAACAIPAGRDPFYISVRVGTPRSDETLVRTNDSLDSVHKLLVEKTQIFVG